MLTSHQIDRHKCLGQVEDLAALPLLQRLLITSDGTLTQLIEAFRLEPVCVQKLLCTTGFSEHVMPELAIESGEPIIERAVVVSGTHSGFPFILAETAIAASHLSQRFIEAILTTATPLGQLWLEHGIEVRKEFVHSCRCYPKELFRGHCDFGRGLLSRQYRLISMSRPIMAIREYFPEPL